MLPQISTSICSPPPWVQAQDDVVHPVVECGPVCTCPLTCPNRVTQRGLAVPLQLQHNSKVRQSSQLMTFPADLMPLLLLHNGLPLCFPMAAGSGLLLRSSILLQALSSMIWWVQGWGAFTVTRLLAGQFVAQYAGELLSNRAADARLAAYDAERPPQGHALLVMGTHANSVQRLMVAMLSELDLQPT